MKGSKYILSLVITYLGLFSTKLEATAVIHDERNHSTVFDEYLIAESKEKEWMCLPHFSEIYKNCFNSHGRGLTKTELIVNNHRKWVGDELADGHSFNTGTNV